MGALFLATVFASVALLPAVAASFAAEPLRHALDFNRDAHAACSWPRITTTGQCA
jgi:hypothetical protein